MSQVAGGAAVSAIPEAWGPRNDGQSALIGTALTTTLEASTTKKVRIARDCSHGRTPEVAFRYEWPPAGAQSQLTGVSQPSKDVGALRVGGEKRFDRELRQRDVDRGPEIVVVLKSDSTTPASSARRIGTTTPP